MNAPLLRRRLLRLALALSLAGVAGVAAAQPSGTARPGGLDGRLIVGYQGWFGCPGDYDANGEWKHWFAGAPGARTLVVDALPVVQQLAPADRCPTGLTRADGSPLELFSSQRPAVVRKHFEWMQEHGIDGAAAQRFVVEIAGERGRRRADNVLRNVRAAAEATGRVFYLTYDVSGADPATLLATLRADWQHVVKTLRLTESPAYLRDGGKPVLQLWGFGFADRAGDPTQVRLLVEDLKRGEHGLQAATLIGGVPTHWRSLSGDSRTEPAWAGVYRAFDVISPWTVGRFPDATAADVFMRTVLDADLAEVRRLGLRYLPVVFPGFSWHNLKHATGQTDAAALNIIPRRCGNFLWRQISLLIDRRVTSIYAAMFDEVDEATALFQVEPLAARLPAGAAMVTLNQDGCALPADWYLRITGEAARLLRTGERAQPVLDLVLRP